MKKEEDTLLREGDGQLAMFILGIFMLIAGACTPMACAYVYGKCQVLHVHGGFGTIATGVLLTGTLMILGGSLIAIAVEEEEKK